MSRNDRPDAIDAQYRAMNARDKALRYLLLGLLSAILGGAVIGVSLWDWNQYAFAGEWPLSIATVTDLQINETARGADVGFEIEFRVNVSYRYDVPGQTLRNVRTFVTNQRPERNALEAQYAVGEQFAVWYHPRWPDIHAAYQFGALYNLALLSVGGVLVLLALWLFARSVERLGRARRYAAG